MRYTSWWWAVDTPETCRDVSRKILYNDQQIHDYLTNFLFQTFAVFWIYYVFLSPPPVNTLAWLGSAWLGSSSHTSNHLPMKMEQIECSETSAYIIQTPGNYPKENIISHKLSHSYMFRHYCVILRELVVSTLLSYTIMSQIITLLLHVSTLLCHPQGARS